MRRAASNGPHWAAPLAIFCAVVIAGCSAGDNGRGSTAAGREVRLFPDPAFVNSRLAVAFAHPERRPTKCFYEWRRNGEVIAGATRSELETSQFAKGDIVSVRVIAGDPGATAAEWVAETHVVNSPPSVTRVGIEIDNGTAGPELRARAECVDPDRDRTSFDYDWFRNGAPVNGARGEVLPAGGFARGDRITVAAVASDGDAASLAVASEPFVVENRAPAFSSQPVSPRPGDTVFEYRAVATDPDGDPLRYELVQGPRGMTVGSRGEVRWELPPAALLQGEAVVRIRALDPNGGQAVQEFTLNLGALVATR
jgi:hypothetical protein